VKGRLGYITVGYIKSNPMDNMTKQHRPQKGAESRSRDDFGILTLRRRSSSAVHARRIIPDGDVLRVT